MAKDHQASRPSPPPLPKGTSGGAQEREMRVGWRMAALGMEVASMAAAGAILGWAFDKWRGTTSGLLYGSIIGILVSLWTLIRGALKLNKQLDRTAPTKGRGNPNAFADEDDTIDAEDDWKS